MRVVCSFGPPEAFEPFDPTRDCASDCATHVAVARPPRLGPLPDPFDEDPEMIAQRERVANEAEFLRVFADLLVRGAIRP